MIRKIEPKDYDKATDLVNEDWKRFYKGIVEDSFLTEEACAARKQRQIGKYKSGEVQAYVYDNGETVCGVLTGARIGAMPVYEIGCLYVAPENHRQGIGKELLAYADVLARENDCNEVRLWVFTDNIYAVKFYAKHGYIEDGCSYLNTKGTMGTRMVRRLDEVE